jgi:metal-responsive CopG/Arc/MetJ family transcriptional regulator
MRTIVDLPNDQIEALKQMSECVHLSRAELMRRAVAEYLMRHQTHPEDHAFGLWKLHEKNSLDYQERMRREWEE